MDMLKTALCNELRNELEKYLSLQSRDSVTFGEMEKSRRKIEGLEVKLTAIEACEVK